MTSFVFRASDAARSTRTGTVLIADTDHRRSAHLQAALAAHGITTEAVSDHRALLDALASAGSDVTAIVASQSIATAAMLEAGPRSTPGTDADRPGVSMPKVVVLDAPHDFDYGWISAYPNTDYVVAPIDVRDLLRRLEVLSARATRQRDADLQATRRTDSVRRALSVIRGAGEAPEILSLLIQLVPPAFGRGAAGVMTLPDERVARLAVHSGITSPFSPDDADAVLPPLRELAEWLWRENSALDLAHRSDSTWFGHRLAVQGQLPPTGIVVPIGAQDTGFGLLWIDRDPLQAWHASEISLLRKVAIQIGHQLVLSQLTATKAKLLRRVREAEQARASLLLRMNSEVRGPLAALLARLDAAQTEGSSGLPEAIAGVVRHEATRPAASVASTADGEPVAAVALTAREREVVGLVGRGWSNGDIASALHLSPLTAKTHVNRAMGKLRIPDRAGLVVWAHREGLVAPK